MPGKHNAGGCGCCCSHCPDYTDDWSFIICGVDENPFWTYVSGNHLDAYLLGLGSFSLSLSSTTVVSANQIDYAYTTTWSQSATYYDGLGNLWVFGDIEATFRVSDYCGKITLVALLFMPDTTKNGTLEKCFILSRTNHTSTPENGVLGCAQLIDATYYTGTFIWPFVDVIQFGTPTVRATTGVVSLTC